MKSFYLAIIVLLLPSISNATLITPTTVTATGSYNHSSGLINDGFIPNESTHWQNAVNVWWEGTIPTFTLDLGNIYNVDDVLVSVDNNDSYAVTWSNNLSTWSHLFTINVGHGEIGGGMDTMSTDNTHAEFAGPDFSSVQARYLRIQATGGDNRYSLGEFQAFGSIVSSVPEPSTLAVFGLGFIGLVTRRFKK